jgi:hypothetical protein
MEVPALSSSCSLGTEVYERLSLQRDNSALYGSTCMQQQQLLTNGPEDNF